MAMCIDAPWLFSGPCLCLIVAFVMSLGSWKVVKPLIKPTTAEKVI
jgi:hypothetical protein